MKIKEIFIDIGTTGESFTIYESTSDPFNKPLVRGRIKPSGRGNNYDLSFFNNSEELLKLEWFRDYLNNALEAVAGYYLKFIELSQERMSLEYNLDYRYDKH